MLPRSRASLTIRSPAKQARTLATALASCAASSLGVQWNTSRMSIKSTISSGNGPLVQSAVATALVSFPGLSLHAGSPAQGR